MSSLHRRSPVVVFLIALVVAYWAEPGQADDRITVLGGEEIQGTLTGIGPEGQVSVEGSEKPLALADIRRIDRAVEPVDSKQPAAVVHFVGGGKLLGKSVVIRDEVCTVVLADGQEVQLPIDAIRAVDVSGLADTKLDAKAGESFQQTVSRRGGESDELFVIVGEQVQSVSGILEEFGEKTVKFFWQDKSQQVARDRVFGVAVAAIGDAPDRAGQALVSLTDGSAIWGKVAGLKDGKLQLAPAEQVAMTVPWDSVMSVVIHNDRLAFLSDLEPLQVEEQTLVTHPQAFRRDLSVGGRKLTLGEKTYQKGLGVHSRSRLRYANEGFDQFAAVIGIDAETGGHGDCEFVVLGDDQELYRQRVRGNEPPRDLQLDVGDYETITLLVEPGEGLDLADHANWCDARLIRGEKPASSAAASQGEQE